MLRTGGNKGQSFEPGVKKSTRVVAIAQITFMREPNRARETPDVT